MTTPSLDKYLERLVTDKVMLDVTTGENPAGDLALINARANNTRAICAVLREQRAQPAMCPGCVERKSFKGDGRQKPRQL